jgi:hypothetical protein
MESLWVKLEDYVKWGCDEYEQYKDMYLNMPQGRVAIEALVLMGGKYLPKLIHKNCSEGNTIKGKKHEKQINICTI